MGKKKRRWPAEALEVRLASPSVGGARDMDVPVLSGEGASLVALKVGSDFAKRFSHSFITKLLRCAVGRSAKRRW